MTISKKLWLGFGSLLLVVAVTSFIIISNFNAILTGLEKITRIKEPTSAAAYQMQISVMGTGLGVLKYLDTGDVTYRSRFAEEEANFERFLARYKDLAENPQSQEIGDTLDRLYEEFKTLGKDLMDAKDRQEAKFTDLTKNMIRADKILDERIRTEANANLPNRLRRLSALSRMNGDNAEIGSWMGIYLREPKKVYREHILSNSSDFQESFSEVKRYLRSVSETVWVAELENTFAQTTKLIQQVLDLNDNLQSGIKKFVTVNRTLDHLLREEVQFITQNDLVAAKGEAHRSIQSSRQVIFFMLGLSLLLSCGSAVSMGRGITGPLHKLVDGTERIGNGMLDHRIDVRTKDEIGELATAFNRMTERRQMVEEDLVESERRLQVLSAHILEAQETERKRLAVEMHDELGQSLSLLKLQLSAIQRKLRADQAHLVEECRESLVYLDNVIENVRRISRDLSPSILEDLGIAAALRRLVEDFSKHHGIETSFNVENITMLFSQQTQIHIYRIFQEVLTNIGKHSQATNVSVTIMRENGSVSFIVEDNGKGFDLEDVLSTSSADRGMGMAAIEKRALMIRSSLDIGSQVGRGTAISFSVPIEQGPGGS